MNLRSARNLLILHPVNGVENGETRRSGKTPEMGITTMLNTPAIILLVLFSVIIVVSYLIVRRGWIRAYPTFVVGGVANALVVFAISLLRGNMLPQAVIVGPFLGFLFVAVSVLMAALWRDIVPSQADKRALIVPTV